MVKVGPEFGLADIFLNPRRAYRSRCAHWEGRSFVYAASKPQAARAPTFGDEKVSPRNSFAIALLVRAVPCHLLCDIEYLYSPLPAHN